MVKRSLTRPGEDPQGSSERSELFVFLVFSVFSVFGFSFLVCCLSGGFLVCVCFVCLFFFAVQMWYV